MTATKLSLLIALIMDFYNNKSKSKLQNNKDSLFMYSKALLIAALFVVGVYSDCATHPMKNLAFQKSDRWSDAGENLAAANMAMCKNL